MIMLNFKEYFLNEQPMGGIAAPAALPPGGPMGGGGMPPGGPPGGLGGSMPPPMGGGGLGMGGPPMGGLGAPPGAPGAGPTASPSIKIKPANFWKLAEKMLSGKEEESPKNNVPEKKRSGLLLGL